MRLPSVLGIKKRGKDRSKRRRRARKNFKYSTNPKIIGARAKTYATVNPLETAGLVAGGLLAARYALKSRNYVKTVVPRLARRNNQVILNNNRNDSIVIGTAYLKGLGKAIRSDKRKIQTGWDYLSKGNPNKKKIR